MKLWLGVGLCMAAGGCTSKPSSGPQTSTQAPTDTATETDAEDIVFTHRFSMAILADPHVTGEGEHQNRLMAAVDWIEANAAAQDIQLVVILGDICWGDGFEAAHTALSRLSMPWVPIMGDNVVVAGQADIYFETFDAQMSRLATQLDDFSIQPAPVYNPQRDKESFLQNIGFDFMGIRFLGVDWSSREEHPLWSETPDLHDFEGGTWPWLITELSKTTDRLDNSLILLSHMPLFEGGGSLTVDEADKVVDAFYPHSGPLWANLAGHLHWSASDTWTRAGIEVHVTDATWDDENTIRVIDVSGNDRGFAYAHQLVVVD